MPPYRDQEGHPRRPLDYEPAWTVMKLHRTGITPGLQICPLSVDRLVIPICVCKTHWCLAMMDFQTREIHVWDSLASEVQAADRACLLVGESKYKRDMLPVVQGITSFSDEVYNNFVAWVHEEAGHERDHSSHDHSDVTASQWVQR